jgi:hypothetical protein
MKRALAAVGALATLFAVLLAFGVFTNDSKVVTAYSVEGTEDVGTVWVKSCIEGDRLDEATLLRGGAAVWSYKLVGEVGASLAEPVDIRVLADLGSYVLSGVFPSPPWGPGDQIVLKSTSGGYVSWVLGGQPQLMSLRELRALPCVAS